MEQGDLMSYPFFSVIINTHNSEATIDRTLQSVINQTFKNFEVIIIDDNSKDNTKSKIIKSIEKFKNKISFIQLRKNLGIANARNVGIEKSNGKYIAFLDGDDLWKKNKLLIQYNVLKHSSCTIDWIFSNYEVIDSEYHSFGKRERMQGVYDYYSIIRHGNPVGMLTVAVKATVLRKNKFRDVRHEDYDLWIRLSKKGYVGVLIDKDLALYMKHRNTVSSNKLKSLLWTYQVFRKNDVSHLKSLFFLLGYIINNYKRKTQS